MSLSRVYLETTIPSYLTARRSRNPRMASHQAVTEKWWNDCRHEYELFVSEFVLVEAAEGEPAMAAARLAVLDPIPVLPATQETQELAEQLLEKDLIPAKAAVDAYHIAMATVHRMDLLLTWNCTHIHNLSIVQRVQRICAAAGYECPLICNPDELLPPSVP